MLLLKEFQIKIMELCIKRVKEQSENFDVKIQEIKQTLTDKVDNIDTLISNINKKTEENQKPIIEASLAKANKIVIKSINVRNSRNPDNSNDETWFHRENNRNQHNRARYNNQEYNDNQEHNLKGDTL